MIGWIKIDEIIIYGLYSYFIIYPCIVGIQQGPYWYKIGTNLLKYLNEGVGGH